MGDDGARPAERDVLAGDTHVAAGPHEPAHGVQERRLPGAVGADEADDLAREHVERHVVDGDDAPEAHGQLLALQERRGRRHDRALVIAERMRAGSDASPPGSTRITSRITPA